MDLSTRYLGLTLRSPLVPSASPLSHDVDNVCRLEDSGAAAVVFHSLFEEQLRLERLDQHHQLEAYQDFYAEAQTFFPEPTLFHVGADEYLEHLAEAKRRCDIPIIGSLNGSTPGGWTAFARDIEEAGADALELNVYAIPTDPDRTSLDEEDRTVEMVRSVTSALAIPVAVKLSPYYTNFAHLARRLAAAGAGGLVLFNRFYQPDVDLDALEVRPSVALSARHELRLPMRWIAILKGRIDMSLAATSGVHGADDVVKALLVGADVAMMCSALLRYGIGFLQHVHDGLVEWMQAREYDSVEQLKGSMSQVHCADPSAFERAQYMRALQGYRLD